MTEVPHKLRCCVCVTQQNNGSYLPNIGIFVVLRNQITKAEFANLTEEILQAFLDLKQRKCCSVLN